MPTLQALLDVLGPAAVTPLTGAEGLGAEVTDVVLVGPGDVLPRSAGTLLVGVEQSADLVARAHAAGAAGLVVKQLGDVVREWADAPLPVLAANDGLPWHHLVQLLTTAVASAGVTRAGAGSTRGGPATGDLFTLASSIAAMVGGAVAIEDPQRRVLAYSSLPDQPIDETRQRGILGRQVPDLRGNDSLYRDLQRAPGVLRVPAEGDRRARLAVAVRAGPELLGSIWVIEDVPLGEEASQALLDAGRLASVHLLRARAGSGMVRRARGELLGELLEGRASPGLAAVRLGVDAARPVAVAGFGLPDATAGDDAAVEAVADLVQLQCAATRPRSSVVVQLRTVYALLPVETHTPRSALTQLATTVVERARAALRVELTGALGATVDGMHAVARSRGDVDAVLTLLQRPGTPPVAAVEDVLPQVVLLDLHAHLSTTPHLRLPAVARLLAHDAEHGTPYAQSVLAHLTADGDVAVAAARMSVHPNTFRYRLRRVRELFGLDLDDPDVRLVAWLQLRFQP